MYCTRCGTKNDDSSVRCTSCQELLQEIPASRPAKRTGSRVVDGVVISIVVSFLFFLFYPSFERHWHAVRTGHCQENLKQLGSALEMYCVDNNDVLPSSAILGSKKWNQASFVRFAEASGRSHSHPMFGWTAALSSDMQNKNIIFCPNDRIGRKTKAPVSYFWKAAVDYAWFQGFKKMASYDFPADQIILYEHNDWHWKQTNRGLTDGVTINCLFLDGHVAYNCLQNSGYTTAENPPSPLPLAGGGEPAWFNYNFVNNMRPKTGMLWNPQTYGDRLR